MKGHTHLDGGNNMAIQNTKIPTYKPAKDIELSWDNFRRGLNILLKETEVSDDELVQADNIVLVGKGVPTKRWGTKLFYLSAATGSVRGIKGFYQADGTNQLLTLTDQGILTKKSSASYSVITGASWASGYPAYMAQLEDNMYIVNGQREMCRYSNPTLTSFSTIATPTSVFATGISGVSGTNTLSYRISSTNQVGETLASSSFTLGDQPQSPDEGSVKISWSAVSTASGVLTGYSIYGRAEGDERFLGGVDSGSTNFIDDGTAFPSEFTFPPTGDSTGGIIAKYIVRFEDRLIFAGIDGEPSKVIISGRVPNQEKLDWSYGGGLIRIEPDAGDNITGLGIFENRIIVFKERSIWQITLSSENVGNFTTVKPVLKLITGSHGCIAPQSIKAVENDVFFLSRKGVYALGYEPNVFNVLRTNEISAKIRPFFNNLSISQQENACAFYNNFKYGISFPGKDKTMVYDRERLAWTGPWSTDANLYEVYYDSSNKEHLLYGEDDAPNAVEYSSDFGDDKGSTIITQLRTKKDDFNDWTRFKNIKEVFTLFRNVQGTVNVSIRLQERSGDIITAKSFSIQPSSGDAGWGSFLWGDAKWGDSPEEGGSVDINEIYKWLVLNKAARNIQVIIQTSNRNDNYEFLSFRARAKPLGYGFLPSSEKVS